MESKMAELVYGMMQSLDGYIAGQESGPQLPFPSEALHRYFNDSTRGLGGMLYGRRMYEIMRYWDEGQSDWGDVERDFADAWRRVPKTVVSRTLTAVGPNASLIGGELGPAVAALKAATSGTIEVAGAELAAGLSQLGLIDEYRLFLMPVVMGGGKPFFSGAAVPDLTLVGVEHLPQETVLLRYRKA
jgi:dihydrofolate reductase